MDEKTAAFLKQKFKEYYFKHVEQIEVPTRMDEREFGYMTFDKIMIRHLSFKNPGDLHALILKEAPNSVYYSISFYTDPSLPMHEKGWKGGELVFDIDADTLSSPCREEHDKWICRECGRQEVGIRPAKCPTCRGTRIHEVNITCDTCLGDAKNVSLNLLDIIVKDLGVQRNEIGVYFSGSMGYHISLSDPMFEGADQDARSEIVDYVWGKTLSPESLRVIPQLEYDELIKRLPSETDPGWRGRVARYFKALQVDGEEGPEDVKVKMAELYRKAGYRKFRSAVEDAARRSGARVDASVTTDIHRIFRLPGTLHGKTGLLKKKCKDLESFDPLEDAVAFGREPMKISVDYSPRFTLMGEEFGPFKSKSIELPMVAAIYLLGLGMATVEG